MSTKATIFACASSRVLLLFLVLGGAARAQNAGPPTSDPSRFEITDNSFLVEEAFNQQRGVFQNIFGATRADGRWAATFTQEWPAPSQTHQLSYTLSFLDAGANTGFGDTLINYRYQALTEGPGRPAFAPRASLVLPTGSSSKGLGTGSAGLQVNLPFSKQTGDWYWHWNGGFTWLPRADVGTFPGDDHHADLFSPSLAGSAIYRLRPMINLMTETVLLSLESREGSATERETLFTLSPGVRGGWNFGEHQLIIGAAVPVTWGTSKIDRDLFFYLSYELPFKK